MLRMFSKRPAAPSSAALHGIGPVAGGQSLSVVVRTFTLVRLRGGRFEVKPCVVNSIPLFLITFFYTNFQLDRQFREFAYVWRQVIYPLFGFLFDDLII